MSEKYKATFTDDQEKYTWILSVIDTDYESYSDRVTADGGTVIGIGCLPLELNELVEFKRLSLGPEAFSLEYGGRGDDFLKPLKGSRVVFSFMAEDNADLSFIDDVASTQEQRFYVRLYRDGSLYWQGPILQDLMRVPYTSFPAAVEIQAICGLARLKGLKVPVVNYSNILDAIAEILRRLDSGQLWASTDDFIRTSVRWYEDRTYTSTPPVGLDTLAYSRLQAKFTNYTFNNDGEKLYRPLDELLGTILRAFGARIFLADGLWVIEQIGEVANSPSRYNVYERDYNYSSGDPSAASGISSTGNSWTTNFQLLGTGTTNRIGTESSWTYLPAVKEFSIRYDVNAINSADLIFLRSVNTYSAFGNVGSSTTLGLFLQLQARRHKIVNSTASTEYCYLEAYATVRLTGTSTTYYMVPGPSVGISVWSTTAARLKVCQVLAIVPASGNVITTQVFPGTDFMTDTIPVSGLLEIKYEVEFKEMQDPTQTNSNVSLGTITVADGDRYFDNRGFRAFMSGRYGTESFDGYTYTVENTVDTESTVEEELDSVFIGDQLNSAGSNGQIEIYDVTNTDWFPSENWKIRGVGVASKDVLEHLVVTAMQLRETPKRLFDLNYFGTFDPIKAFTVGVTKNYFWNWLKLTASTNFIETESYELEQSSTSYTATNEYEYVSLDVIDNIFRASGGIGGGGIVGEAPNPIGTPINGLTIQEQSGTITSIPMSKGLRFTLGFAGDIIQVVQTDGTITEFTLSENALVGHTTLSVESQAISGVLAEGSRILAPDGRNTLKNASLYTYDITRFTQTELLLLQEGGGFEDPSDIQAWLDFSAGGHNFSAVDVAMTEKGKFATIFNGTSSYLANSTLDVTQPFTLAFAINLKETNSGRYILHSDGSTGTVFDIYTGTGDNVTIKVGATTATATITRDQFVVFQLVVNGASSKFRQNLNSFTAASLGTDHIKHPTIGYDGGSGFCEMDLTAVCIFERVLTDDELDGLFINLEARV